MADRPIQIMRSSSSPYPIPTDATNVIAQVTEYLDAIEGEVETGIVLVLRDFKSDRNRGEADNIFGWFTSAILIPYSRRAMGSRAAHFATENLIPAVLRVEDETGRQIHKGALFYDTALAYLIAGNDDQFEYYLAMADEEDNFTHQVEGNGLSRGKLNLRATELSSQTISHLVEFFAGLLNGVAIGSTINFANMCGGPVTQARLENWRQSLESLHHFELFRMLRELKVFCGTYGPNYPAVLDNPYVMLRIGKAVGHAAQWAESDLTRLQNHAFTGSLSPKLKNDPAFTALSTAAGNQELFAGNMPQGSAAVNAELRVLLNQIQAAVTDDEKHWRLLRVLYIVRNSTAHVIDPALALHTDRAFALEILHSVLISIFVIRQRKVAIMP